MFTTARLRGAAWLPWKPWNTRYLEPGCCCQEPNPAECAAGNRETSRGVASPYRQAPGRDIGAGECRTYRRNIEEKYGVLARKNTAPIPGGGDVQ